MTDKPLDRELVRRLPKVSLHDHLDGGLRPSTVLDLAGKAGYDGLPESEPEALSEWFFRGAARGSLSEYLEGFQHTIAVMQTAEALERIAFEYVEDLHEDGVVYGEVRFAPHFHTTKGLGLDAVMEAVLAGLARGNQTYGLDMGVIVCALRNQDAQLSLRLAELAASWFDRGVVGFDLAGEEAGHPPKDHLDAFQLIQRHNGSITIHAGEGFGPESIWQALQYCGAHRIGHGTRLIEDMVLYEGKVISTGKLANFVLDHRIPIEVCLASNVHTGATPSLAEHPFPVLLREGFRVTLNTDNRLMSRTTMTDEFMLAQGEFGHGIREFERVTVNAMNAAFWPYRKRQEVLSNRIEPGYAAVRAEIGAPPSARGFLEDC